MGQTRTTQNQTRDPYGPAVTGLTDMGGHGGHIDQQFGVDQANTLVPAAQKYTQGMIAGDHLNPNTNPHLASLMNVVGDETQSRLAAMAGLHGRGNFSGADLQQNAAKGISAGLAGPLFAQHQQGLALQQQAAASAPGMATAGGLATDNALQRYLALGNAGGTSTGTSTSTPSALQTAAGIGLTAAGIGMGMPGLGMMGGSMFSPGGMFGGPGAVGKAGSSANLGIF